MLDRASTFAEPEIVEMLKTRFVPVAINQAEQRRQKDAEGMFYRKIAQQGPRNNFNATTQGFYIATASGKLLLYNNNRNPEKVRDLMKESLAQFDSLGRDVTDAKAIQADSVDSQFVFTPPEGGLVVRVQAKILDGYEPTTDRWEAIFQSALSRDNLWISADEHQALVRGEFPISLQHRIARFHLVDNTRGEPPMWNEEDIKEIKLEINNKDVTGQVRLASPKSDSNTERGYEAAIRGVIEVKNNKVVRLDLVALGSCWGEGTFTRGAPKGKFPLAISFTLADNTDIADKVPPQASRGWLRGYLP